MSLKQELNTGGGFKRQRKKEKKFRETRKIKQDCLTIAQLKESIFSLHTRGAVQILS